MTKITYKQLDTEDIELNLMKKDNIVSNIGVFNSTSGVIIEHNLDLNDYDVIIQPCSDTLGTLGEYWTELQTNNSFTVKNSGTNTTSSFKWILIKR